MALSEAMEGLRRSPLLSSLPISNEKILDETLKSIKILTELFFDQKMRDELCEEDCYVLMRTLEICQLHNENENLELITELFRCLRNVCAYNKRNQNWITKLPEYYNVILSYVTNLITILSHGQDDSPVFIKRIECLRCGLQFIGNLIVGHELNKYIVWEKLFPYFSWLLEQNADDRIMRYSCMIMYNCLSEMPRHRKHLLENADNRIFSVLLNITMLKEIEWGLYIIELMLEEDGFISVVFNQINEQQKFYLLDIVQNYLHSQRITEPTNRLFLFSVNNLDFLKEVFLKKVDLVLKMCQNFNCTSNDPILVMKLLAILCSTSANEKYQKHLQNDENLIIIVTFFLRGIHLAGKEGNEYFTPVEKLSEATNLQNEKLQNNPVHGIKRDLVRLIGNLCWECKENQDKVREMEGIAVLLDCCRIDAQNPFIIQWVIFTIHNLCDRNLENQAVIANMENLGFSDSSMDKIREAILKTDKNENLTEENYNFCCEEFEKSVSLSKERNSNDTDDKYSDVKDLFF